MSSLLADSENDCLPGWPFGKSEACKSFSMRQELWRTNGVRQICDYRSANLIIGNFSRILQKGIRYSLVKRYPIDRSTASELCFSFSWMVESLSHKQKNPLKLFKTNSLAWLSVSSQIIQIYENNVRRILLTLESITLHTARSLVALIC